MNKNPEKFAIEYLMRNGYKLEEAYNNLARQVVMVAIGALEKQIPKKGIPCNSDKNHNFIKCGACNRDMGLYYRYCPVCGQRSHWN